jgi:hypothetical protein
VRENETQTEVSLRKAGNSTRHDQCGWASAWLGDCLVAHEASNGSRDDDVLGEGLEPVAVGLDDRNCRESALAEIDVAHNTRLARMGAADDLAPNSISQLRGGTIFGVLHGGEFLRLASKMSHTRGRRAACSREKEIPIHSFQKRLGSTRRDGPSCWL